MREDSGRNVVVGIDGSEHSIAALDLAAAEAEARGLPLRIVHAYLWPVISRPYAPAARGRQVVRNAMVRVLRARPWLSVDSRVTGDGPAYALIGESRTADLVVVGCRGRDGLASMLARAVSTQLATHARCPVILVRPAGSVVPLTTDAPVVVGVDGSDMSHHVLGFAFGEAVFNTAHVWTPTSTGDDTAAEDDARRLLDTALTGWPDKYPQVAVTRLTVRAAHPADALATASARAVLLVVGSRTGSALRGVLLGSAAYRLVHTAHCPVAVVRSTRTV